MQSDIIRELSRQGQSVWCDNLGLRMLDAGGRSPFESLRGLIDLGIVGVTSNPTIFLKSISSGDEYDDRFSRLTHDRRDLLSLYEGLVLPDIADAADLLRPIFDRTDGVDGYVSLEVNPRLAHDTDATIAEARRLFAEVDRPNVFIKVPATAEGIPAIRALIADGVNVNVTLIFSLESYQAVMTAYIDGLRQRASAGLDVSRTASVASFFVSRVDTLIDKLLHEKKERGANVADLFGRAATANARLAYARFEEVFFHSGQFADLSRLGARVQRPLWASTSVKNPDYPDTKYVDDLVAPYSVNTMPPETIRATVDHGRTAVTIHDQLDDSRRLFSRLADLNIDFRSATDKLLNDGVAAFVQSFDELLANLSRKQRQPVPVSQR